jgi:hypothetical protein
VDVEPPPSIVGEELGMQNPRLTPAVFVDVGE